MAGHAQTLSSLEKIPSTQEITLTPSKDLIVDMYFKEKALIERLFAGKIKERLLENLEEKRERDLKRSISS